MPPRFEAPHDPVSLSERLVRILRPIVHAFMEAVLDAGHDREFSGVIGSELIGNHRTRRTALPLQQLAHQALGRFGVVAALGQNVKDETVLIEGAPKKVLLSWIEWTTSLRYNLSPSRPRVCGGR